MARDRSTPLTLLIFLALTVACAWPLVDLQHHIDQLRGQQTAEQSINLLPSGRFLSTAVLGFDNLAADLLWVRGISLFGEKYDLDKDPTWNRWLFQLIDVATDLDPLDVRIYKYGGLMLRLDAGRIDQSTYVFHKGMEHLPREYFFPFGIAMNYFEVKADARKAAEYMQVASTLPGAPFFLRNLAATLLDQSRQKQNALTFLSEQLAQLTPGSLPYKAVEVKILEVKHDIAAHRLQLALQEYLSIYNRLPSSLQAMRGKTFTGPWPMDPYGGKFVLDPVSGRILSSGYWSARARIRREVGLGVDRDNKETSAEPTKAN